MQYLQTIASSTLVRSSLVRDLRGYEWAMTTRSGATAAKAVSRTAEVLAMREASLGRLGLSGLVLVRCGQVHGDDILHVPCSITASYRGRSVVLEPSDGLFSNCPDTALGIVTADCAAVTVVSPETGSYGIVHSGWRSTALNIAGKLVRNLCDNYGADPAMMLAVISPTISGKYYEVGTDVLDALAEDDRIADILPAPDSMGKAMLDLVSVIVAQLWLEGLAKVSIERPSLCTYERADLFHSWRRDADMGRMLTVIAKLGGCH